MSLLEVDATTSCTPDKMAAAGDDYVHHVKGGAYGGAYANLDRSGNLAKGFVCKGESSGTTTYGMSLFNIGKVITESEVHYAKFRVRGDMCDKNCATPKSMGFQMSAGLETMLYGVKVDPIKAGFEKVQGISDESKAMKFFVQVLGFNVYDSSKETDWKELKGHLFSKFFETVKGYVTTATKQGFTYQSANNVCGGKFDFSWIGGSDDISEVAKSGAFTMSVEHAQSFLSVHRVVCFAYVCVDVFFDISGTVQVQPGFYWNRCDSSSGGADTFVLGIKPSAKLVMTLELGANVGFMRAGAGGALTVLKAALPAYGRKTKTGACASLDLSAGAFAGHLYLYLDFFNPFALQWERALQYNFLDWSAYPLQRQLYEGIPEGLPGAGSCKSGSRCTWNWQTPFNLESRKNPNECMYPKGGSPGSNKRVQNSKSGCKSDKRYTLEAVPAGDGTFYLQSSKSPYNCLHPSANAAIDLLDNEDAMEADELSDRVAEEALVENAANTPVVVHHKKRASTPVVVHHVKCPKDLGRQATCKWVNCWSWRNAKCENAKCVCGPRQCVEWDPVNSGNRCVTAPAPTPAPRPPAPPAQPTKGTKLVFQAGCTEKKFAVKFVKVHADDYFVEGSKGSTKCPSGSTVITSESDCKAAATAVGFVYKKSGSFKGAKGCMNWNTKYVHFNTGTGSSHSSASPLCTASYFYLKSKKSGLCVQPTRNGWTFSENCVGAHLQLKEVPREENVYGYCSGKYRDE